MEQFFNSLHIEQNNIFNEPELLFSRHYIEPTFYSIKNHIEENTGIPLLLDFYDESIPLDNSCCICTECGNAMIRHNREYMFSEIDIIPDHIKARNYVKYVYSCQICSEKGIKIWHKTPAPYPVIKKCLASPDTIAYLIKCRYMDFMPLKDIEKSYDAASLPISQNIISSWMIKAAVRLLLPFYELLGNELMTSRTILYSSMKPVILRNENRLLKPNVTIWAYEKPDVSDKPIIFYAYSTPHEGLSPHRFLKTYSGSSFKLDVSVSLSDFSNRWVLADNYKNCSDINKCCYAIYSIIKTAEANNVEPYGYIRYLLRNLAFRNTKKSIKESKDLLPWFYNAPSP